MTDFVLRPAGSTGAPMDWRPSPPDFLWTHSGLALAAWGSVHAIDVGIGADRFRRGREALKEFFSSVESDVIDAGFGRRPLAFGSFSFDPETGGSTLVVPRTFAGGSGDERWTVHAGSGAPPGPEAPAPVHEHDRIRYLGSTQPEVSWLEAVDEAVRMIRSTGLRKVVLARDEMVWSKDEFDVRLLARRLVERFPDCYVFFCDGLLGATPELLVRLRGTEVESLVLAGSTARGTTAGEDEQLAARLAGSAKNVEEHNLTVESVVSPLEGCCRNLRVDRQPWLLKLANVQHLATRVRATLADDLTALDIAGLLHPTAAVCGAPTTAAMDAIRKLEAMGRGSYCGPVGWVDAAGDGEFGIALRCAEIRGSRARLFAGAGIVDGSEPVDELEETRIKLRAMQSALEGPKA